MRLLSCYLLIPWAADQTIICTEPLYLFSCPSSWLMSVSLDAVSLSPFLSGSISCSLLILSTPHHSFPSSLLPSGYFLTIYPVGALPLPIAILLSASSRTFHSLFPPSLSTSLPLSSPCSPDKSFFSASSPPPAPWQTSTEWSNAGRWGLNTVS